jgi:hypothetical protein
MNYFIEKDKLIKSIAIDDDQIMVADDVFNTPQELEAYLNGGKKGWMDTALSFRYSAVNQIKLFESDNCIQLLVNSNGKTEKVAIEFTAKENYNWLLALLNNKTKLTPTHSSLNSGGGFAKVKNYLYVVAAAMFSIALAGMAYEQEHGNDVAVLGGRRGLKRILISIAEALGFYGSILVGLVITGGVLYYAIRQNKALAQGTV